MPDKENADRPADEPAPNEVPPPEVREKYVRLWNERATKNASIQAIKDEIAKVDAELSAIEQKWGGL